MNMDAAFEKALGEDMSEGQVLPGQDNVEKAYNYWRASDAQEKTTPMKIAMKFGLSAAEKKEFFDAVKNIEPKRKMNEEWMARKLKAKGDSMVSKVSNVLDYDIEQVAAFCVAVLEDVNAHEEAAAVNAVLEPMIAALTKESVQENTDTVVNQDASITEGPDRLTAALNTNKGGDPKQVAAAEKAANTGHWLDRYIGIAKAVGDSDAEHLEALKNVWENRGSTPALESLANELISDVAFNLVTAKGWTKDDLAKIAWGIPDDVMKDAGLPTGLRKTEKKTEEQTGEAVTEAVDEHKIRTELIAKLGANHSDEINKSFKETGTNSFEFTVDGDEYEGYDSEEWAEDRAKDDVKQQLEDEPWEMFSHDFLNRHLSMSPTDIRVMASDESDAAIADMDPEEMVKQSSVSDEWDDAFDKDDAKKMAHLEKVAEEELIDKKYEEVTKALTDDPVAYFDEIGGDEMVKDMIKKHMLRLDVDAAAQEAINTDGWAHFMSRYDGEYESLPSGAVYFRQG